ncbi:MAG TPA: hypothetical protein VEK77_02885 [Gemmatimonadales bacterium]|nr:hypothetical protein [Gemmatimonadales bacterium]
MRGHHAVALAVAVSGCDGGKTALRYHPPRGAVYHFTLTMRNGVEHGQNRTWTIYFTEFVRFTDPNGGGTEVGVRVDSTAPDISQLRGQTSSVFLDGRGRLMRSDPPEFPGLSADLAYRMRVIASAGAISFPEERVRVGDTWTITTRLPLEAFGAAAQELGKTQATVTLKAIQVRDADTLVVLGIDEKLPPDPILITSGGIAMIVHPSGSVTGEYRFSLARGTVITETLRGTMTLNVAAAALGKDTLLVSSVTETTLHLQ